MPDMRGLIIVVYSNGEHLICRVELWLFSCLFRVSFSSNDNLSKWAFRSTTTKRSINGVERISTRDRFGVRAESRNEPTFGGSSN